MTINDIIRRATQLFNLNDPVDRLIAGDWIEQHNLDEIVISLLAAAIKSDNLTVEIFYDKIGYGAGSGSGDGDGDGDGDGSGYGNMARYGPGHTTATGSGTGHGVGHGIGHRIGHRIVSGRQIRITVESGYGTTIGCGTGYGIGLGFGAESMTVTKIMTEN